ncbi:hypothetical protein PHMEG_00035094 [Phytophthora megakarya]|uniref:Uncharacterized protein n=1 Tax=Phytophthora megakarya TaxID=4795 RepID=A0A225US51_9STRA|nr:hypothetical protein PHMEG_00035094 [Phytophthora megakarya]
MALHRKQRGIADNTPQFVRIPTSRASHSASYSLHDAHPRAQRLFAKRYAHERSPKISSLQLRVCFILCVLLYFGAIYFADDIASFGRVVGSEQNSQNFFVHSLMPRGRGNMRVGRAVDAKRAEATSPPTLAPAEPSDKDKQQLEHENSPEAADVAIETQTPDAEVATAKMEAQATEPLKPEIAMHQDEQQGHDEQVLMHDDAPGDGIHPDDQGENSPGEQMYNHQPEDKPVANEKIYSNVPAEKIVENGQNYNQVPDTKPVESEQKYNNVPDTKLIENGRIYNNIPDTKPVENEQEYNNVLADNPVENEQVYDSVQAGKPVENDLKFNHVPEDKPGENEQKHNNIPADKLAENEQMYNHTPDTNPVKNEQIYDSVHADKPVENGQQYNHVPDSKPENVETILTKLVEHYKDQKPNEENLAASLAPEPVEKTQSRPTPAIRHPDAVDVPVTSPALVESQHVGVEVDARLEHPTRREDRKPSEDVRAANEHPKEAQHVGQQQFTETEPPASTPAQATESMTEHISDI